jgi:GDP-L-fucose synthase
LDLINQQSVINFFKAEKPDYVFLAAAKVGGIVANNNYPADFIYENIMIQANVIHQAYENGVKKLMFLGSSCIYPKMAPQPLKEDYLLTGLLEQTNEPYAIAKITGIKMCDAYRAQHGCNFISVMPTNLYGPNDNYHPIESHVIPSLIFKIHYAKLKKKKKILLLGTGKAKRDFLFVDDLTEFAITYLLNSHKTKYQKIDYVNVGSGNEISIKNLAIIICKVIEYKGKIIFDKKSPDGHKSKLLDDTLSKNLGFKKVTALEKGLKIAYSDFLKRIKNEKKK